MKGLITSYSGLFSHGETALPQISRIEIPLIQRDYAQGRAGGRVEQIRNNFLDVLQHAVLHGKPVSLDFVYGEVKGDTLRPLDGQQRLTTLFLLHWYVAFRAGRLDEAGGWKQFSYATRPSARLFCERLVASRPPTDLPQPSIWMQDQAWYLYTWRHDPTIQSMLVMLDAIHERFSDADCTAAWQRLTDPVQPAISFHLLADEQLGLTEELYIKMNSRGKPLTPFETFKARFERLIETTCPSRAQNFALKVDGAWADLLWPYHGGDFIVDDEFMRYVELVTELCEWREGKVENGRIEPRAAGIFGPENPRASEHLDFLFHCFDTWVDTDIQAEFDAMFTKSAASMNSGTGMQVRLFGPQAELGNNLFKAGCHHYGRMRGRNRTFNLAHSLLLFAVLIQRMKGSADFQRRLRVLRNLIEASSGNELRLEKMPVLMADVEHLVVDGTLDGIDAFNQAQVEDERKKATMLHECPVLEPATYRLEDHPILRGSLTAFEFEPATFNARAEAFHQLFDDKTCWPTLTGALLAQGDYGRKINARVFQLGCTSNEAPWRELLAGASREKLTAIRKVLAGLLDLVAHAQTGLTACLDNIQSNWLQSRTSAGEMDWRFYFVKYAAMRGGKSGIYVGLNGTLGYSVCMLDKRRMSSWYRDPYLLAMWLESGVGNAVEDPWFTGYETHPRWLRLNRSGAQLRCVDTGIALQRPADAGHGGIFDLVCTAHGVAGDLLTVPQKQRGGCLVDCADRVEMGARLLSDLVKAGL